MLSPIQLELLNAQIFQEHIMPQRYNPDQDSLFIQPFNPEAKTASLNFGETQHDTFEISEIYLQRPQKLASMAFSQWFCLAHGLHDWNLQQAASLGDCKRQLIDKKYVFLPLEPLKAFNALHSKKERELQR